MLMGDYLFSSHLLFDREPNHGKSATTVVICVRRLLNKNAVRKWTGELLRLENNNIGMRFSHDMQSLKPRGKGTPNYDAKA